MFEPGIILEDPSELYLPFLGPRTLTTASAAAAPHKCTVPDPA